MGISGAGALVFISLSWLGQSPLLMRRLGLGGLRLNLRVRAFTGIALAFLLLSVAFFLAGVPLGTGTENETLAQQEATLNGGDGAPTESSASEDDSTSPPKLSPLTPETGAFSGPPGSRLSPSAEAPTTAAGVAQETRVTSPTRASETSTGATNEPAEPASPSATPPPTQTATPLATATPYPTLTATTIAGPTAVISTSGSTLWLKRSPGGQNLTLLRDGDVVLLRPGRANQGGLLWRQVATVAGIEGWVQEEFLLVPGSESGG
jgi:hypothetical protein